MDLGIDKVKPYLPVIIAPLFRELNSTYSDQGNSVASLLNTCMLGFLSSLLNASFVLSVLPPLCLCFSQCL